MWQRIKSIVDDRVIRPLRESHAPIDELSMGSLVGMFWAITPLVGVQMPLVAITWFFLKLFRVRMNLPVAIAWVWISNPVTMPVMYYSFYLSGILVYQIAGIDRIALSFDSVKQVLGEANDMPVIDGVMHWTNFMLESMGWPMMIGCLVFAIPLAIVSYPITKRMVNDYRRRKADGLGLTLDEWEARYVYKTIPIDQTPEMTQGAFLDDDEEDAPASRPAQQSATAPARSKPRKKASAGRAKKATGKKANAKKSSATSAKKKTATARKASKKSAAKSGRKNAKAAFKSRPATA